MPLLEYLFRFWESLPTLGTTPHRAGLQPSSDGASSPPFLKWNDDMTIDIKKSHIVNCGDGDWTPLYYPIVKYSHYDEPYVPEGPIDSNVNNIIII